MAILIKQIRAVEGGNYPCVKKIINGELVVLFVAPNCGLVIKGDCKLSAGHYAQNWFENYFMPFFDGVTMEERNCNNE